MKPDHEDLWKDLLDDALAPMESARALDAMKQAGSRRRTLRSAAQLAACGLILLGMLVLLFGRQSMLPPQSTSLAYGAAKSALDPARAVSPVTSALEVRFISDQELAKRLEETGFTLAIANPEGARRILLVDPKGIVHEP